MAKQQPNRTGGEGGALPPRPMEPRKAPEPPKPAPQAHASTGAHAPASPVVSGGPQLAHAGAHGGHVGPGHHGVEEHNAHQHVPVSVYWVTFAWLMVLLVVTLGAAAVDLGWLNLPIALTIALAKMAFIMANFMHLRFSTSLVRTFGVAAFLWLIILFLLTLSDYFSRGWIRGGQ